MAKTAKGLYAASKYEISGTRITRKKQNCPKCGPGTFLAQHKDRQSCGKCHYTTFSKK